MPQVAPDTSQSPVCLCPTSVTTRTLLVTTHTSRRSSGPRDHLHKAHNTPAAHTMLLRHSQAHSSSLKQQQQSSSRTGTRPVLVRAGGAGGFGKSNKKKVDTASGIVVPEKAFRNTTLEELKDNAPAKTKSKAEDGAPAGFPEGWVDLKFTVNDFPLGKTTKPIELATRTVMVYKFDNRVFVSDASSTAYQYPMTDAKLSKDPQTGRVSAEVPLDGTIYDLSTGAVLKWCPKDNPVRGLLGTLKSKEDPVDLQVYPVHISKDGNIWTKLR